MKEKLLFYIVVFIHTTLFFMFAQEFEFDFFTFIGSYFAFTILALFITPITVIEVFILDILFSFFTRFLNTFIKKKKVI